MSLCVKPLFLWALHQHTPSSLQSSTTSAFMCLCHFLYCLFSFTSYACPSGCILLLSSSVSTNPKSYSWQEMAVGLVHFACMIWSVCFDLHHFVLRLLLPMATRIILYLDMLWVGAYWGMLLWHGVFEGLSSINLQPCTYIYMVFTWLHTRDSYLFESQSMPQIFHNIPIPINNGCRISLAKSKLGLLSIHLNLIICISSYHYAFWRPQSIHFLNFF